MKYVYVPKGEYLFKEDDSENLLFYGIIKGEIIIKKKKSLEEKINGIVYNEGLFVEIELMKASDGYCFGESSLIYKTPRTASVYANTDLHLFSLDQNAFNTSFHVNIIFIIFIVLFPTSCRS